MSQDTNTFLVSKSKETRFLQVKRDNQGESAHFGAVFHTVARLGQQGRS